MEAGKLVADLHDNSGGPEIVAAVKQLAQAMENHTAEEGRVLASAVAQVVSTEFGKHVELHHDPILNALYGEPIEKVGGEVVKREGGLIAQAKDTNEKVSKINEKAENGGLPSKLSRKTWYGLAAALLASPWVDDLFKLIFDIGEQAPTVVP